MRKKKDPEPDPDPYLQLMDPDPDPGGPKTCPNTGLAPKALIMHLI
jgi:hypothetical protein